MNVFGTEDTVVVALCDEGLPGETLKHGDLEVEVEPRFYVGELTTEEGALEELERVIAEYRHEKTVAVNALGERACRVVLRAGLADEDDLGDIAGVPHVQVYLLPRE